MTVCSLIGSYQVSEEHIAFVLH